LRNFNPRSPAGSDEEPEPFDVYKQLISIHAPLRGATLPILKLKLWVWLDFNPRSPAGSDVWKKQISKQEIEISIHAPLRGATAKLH